MNPVLKFRSLLIRSTMAGVFTLSICSADSAVSYSSQIAPIFKESCNGCHHPGKMKGDLDLTTHSAILKGGKHGPILSSGNPKSSLLIEEISGEKPSMPEEGDPLTPGQVDLIERWIAEGAVDDTPAEKRNPYKIVGAPVYPAPALISSLRYSPDGATIAVSGYHEVLLYTSDGSKRIGRLIGESPKIDSLAFSSDGKLLAVAGGAPAVFGEIQIWDVAELVLLNAWKISNDSLYGVAFSPDNKRISLAGADKSVRVLNVSDGTETLKFDSHSDWVFGTTFSLDGTRLLSGGRDKAMKLIDLSNGQFIDDINNPLEEIICMARHPSQDAVVYGGAMGHARVYRISDNQGRTVANKDMNLQRTFERYPGPIQAVAFSPDGGQIALAGAGSDECRIYNIDGTRAATLKSHAGAIFSLAWHPERKELMTGGFEGLVRIFDSTSGAMISSFNPFPLQEREKLATTN